MTQPFDPSKPPGRGPQVGAALIVIVILLVIVAIFGPLVVKLWQWAL